MEKVSDISRGLGRFTPKLWRRLWDAVLFVEQNRGPIESMRALRQERKQRRIWVLLTGYSQVSTNRYKYAWVQARWNSTDEKFERDTRENVWTSYGGTYDPDNPDENTPFNDPAYSSIENGNNGLWFESAGVNVEGVNYPSAFYLQPLRGDDMESAQNPGTEGYWSDTLAPAVEIVSVNNCDAEGVTWIIPNAMNQHDGTCG